MKKRRLEIPTEKLAEFCRQNHILKLSFFGSVLRDDFGPESDVDVLVEFEPGHTPGYDLITMQDELSALLGGREVDLLTPKFLNSRIRDRVLREAEPQYVDQERR